MSVNTEACSTVSRVVQGSAARAGDDAKSQKKKNPAARPVPQIHSCHGAWVGVPGRRALLAGEGKSIEKLIDGDSYRGMGKMYSRLGNLSSIIFGRFCWHFTQFSWLSL